MKILYISPRDVLKARSDPIHIMASCRGFKKAGAEVELVTPSYDRPENIRAADMYSTYGIAEDEEFAVTRLPTNLRDESWKITVRIRKVFSFFRYALELLMKKKEHLGYRNYIIYGKCLLSTLPFMIVSKATASSNLSVVFEAASFGGGPFERAFLKRCDRIVAINPTLAEDLARDLPYPKSRILVPPVGVDTAFEKELRKSKSDARGELGLNDYGFIVLYAGKIYEGGRTEIDLIMQAAGLLPRATFIFTGGGKDVVGRYRDKADRAGLGNILFTGFLSSLRSTLLYMRAADVLVSFYPKSVPTIRYMVPNKIAQYSRSGTVIVAARYPALEFMLGPGGAIYVEPENVESLADAVTGVMEGRIDAMGVARNARERLMPQSYEMRAEAVLRFVEEGR